MSSSIPSRSRTVWKRGEFPATVPTRAIGVLVFGALALWPLLASLSSLDLSLWQSLAEPGGAYRAALRRSLTQTLLVFGLTFLLVWPAGAAALSFRQPQRTAILALGFVMLVVPPFLLAVGFQFWQSMLDFRHQAWLDGRSGAFVTQFARALPLALLGTMALATSISRAESEAALLVGGRSLRFRLTLRRLFSPILGTTFLASVAGSTQLGGNQLMGYPGVAEEWHFALQTDLTPDRALAMSLGYGLTLLVVALPAAWMAGRGWKEVIWRSSDLIEGEERLSKTQVTIASYWPLAILFLVALPPLLGLLFPLLRSSRPDQLVEMLGTVWSRSWDDTLLAFLLAGASAVLGGILLVFLGRWLMVRPSPLLLLSYLVMVLPGPPSALLISAIRGHLPEGLAPLANHPASVFAFLGFRWSWLSLLFLHHGLSRIPAAARESGDLVGTSRLYRFRWLEGPALWRSAVISFVIGGALVLADPSTTVLLTPPGYSTLPMHLLAMMDNAPTGLTGALCLSYLIFTVIVILPLARLLRHAPDRPRP